MGFTFNFFRSTPHRVFHYDPRYYDPKKEAMEERYARLSDEEKAKEGKYIPGKYIRTHMRNNLYKNKKDSGKVLAIRLVILVSIIVLLVAAYYLTGGLGFLLTPSN